MGKYYGPWVDYTCINDCQQSGCPGHKVRETVCRSSDVLSFEFDDGHVEYFDEERWKAMKAAELAARAERAPPLSGPEQMAQAIFGLRERI
jgi:hypothetical protein